MQSPNTKEQNSLASSTELFVLITGLLVLPMLIPVVYCFMQAWLWTVVLSKINGVFFSFGLVEAALFVATLSSFTFAISALIAMGRIIYSKKSLKQYLADQKTERTEAIESLKAQGLKYDKKTLLQIGYGYIIYILSNIVGLILCAHYFPGKIGFDQPQLILYCTLISTTLRALFSQWILLVTQYSNNYLETIKARYNTEDRTT